MYNQEFKPISFLDHCDWQTTTTDDDSSKQAGRQRNNAWIQNGLSGPFFFCCCCCCSVIPTTKTWIFCVRACVFYFIFYLFFGVTTTTRGVLHLRFLFSFSSFFFLTGAFSLDTACTHRPPPTGGFETNVLSFHLESLDDSQRGAECVLRRKVLQCLTELVGRQIQLRPCRRSIRPYIAASWPSVQGRTSRCLVCGEQREGATERTTEREGASKPAVDCLVGPPAWSNIGLKVKKKKKLAYHTTFSSRSNVRAHYIASHRVASLAHSLCFALALNLALNGLRGRTIS